LRLASVYGRPSERHLEAVAAAAFTPGATRLVTAGRDGVTLVWDLESRKVVGRLVATRAPRSAVAVSRDGARVLVAEGASAILYDLASAAAIGSFGLGGELSAIALAPG